MLCEKCRKRQAEVAIREELGGGTRELYVCCACAGAGKPGAGEPIEQKVASMVELIFDVAMGLAIRPAEAQAVPGDPVCAVCGMSRQTFRKRERLGCEACYAAFGRDTEAMIRDMHEGVRHVGKVPAGAAVARTQIELERALKRAVETQRFEEAARLRDELAGLSPQNAASGSDGCREAGVEGGGHVAP